MTNDTMLRDVNLETDARGRVAVGRLTTAGGRLGVYVQWSPMPKRPWGVHESDGRLVKRFDTAEQACAHLNKIITED